MSEFYVATAVALLGTFVVGAIRILRGPTGPDRMMAAQLFGTIGVAITLLLSRVQTTEGLLDVALVLALLALLAAVAFVRRTVAEASLPGGEE